MTIVPGQTVHYLRHGWRGRAITATVESVSPYQFSGDPTPNRLIVRVLSVESKRDVKLIGIRFSVPVECVQS